MSRYSLEQKAVIRASRPPHKPLFAWPLVLLLAACSGSPPAGLGVRDGRLPPCPDSPNCVSSQAGDTDHQVAPLAMTGNPEQARARLLRVLEDEPRVRLVTSEAHYLHAEFSSRVFRFVDDVEFLIGDQAVDVRSASRLGYADFGVNRARIEHLRQRLDERP